MLATSLRLIHNQLLKLVFILGLALALTLCGIHILIIRSFSLLELLKVSLSIILELAWILHLLLNRDGVALHTRGWLEGLHLDLILSCTLWVHLCFDLRLRRRYIASDWDLTGALSHHMLTSTGIVLYSTLFALVDEDLMGVGVAGHKLHGSKGLLLLFYLCSAKWTLTFLRLSKLIVR